MICIYVNDCKCRSIWGERGRVAGCLHLSTLWYASKSFNTVFSRSAPKIPNHLTGSAALGCWRHVHSKTLEGRFCPKNAAYCLREFWKRPMQNDMNKTITFISARTYVFVYKTCTVYMLLHVHITWTMYKTKMLSLRSTCSPLWGLNLLAWGWQANRPIKATWSNAIEVTWNYMILMSSWILGIWHHIYSALIIDIIHIISCWFFDVCSGLGMATRSWPPRMRGDRAAAVAASRATPRDTATSATLTRIYPSTHILRISCDNQVGIPCSGGRYQSWGRWWHVKNSIGFGHWHFLSFLEFLVCDWVSGKESPSSLGWTSQRFKMSCTQRLILLRDCTKGTSGPQCGDSQCHALNMPIVFKCAKWNLMKPEWTWMNQI